MQADLVDSTDNSPGYIAENVVSAPVPKQSPKQNKTVLHSFSVQVENISSQQFASDPMVVCPSCFRVDSPLYQAARSRPDVIDPAFTASRAFTGPLSTLTAQKVQDINAAFSLIKSAVPGATVETDERGFSIRADIGATLQNDPSEELESEKQDRDSSKMPYNRKSEADDLDAVHTSRADRKPAHGPGRIEDRKRKLREGYDRDPDYFDRGKGTIPLRARN